MIRGVHRSAHRIAGSPASLLAPIVAACLAVTLGGCSRHAGPPPPGPAPAASTPNAAPGFAADGIPQIALAPDGVHIDYRAWGRGEPAVVLLHGWACDANYWSAQIEPLKARYTVVAINLAGHGASGSNRSDWSLPAYAGDVVTVLKQVPQRHVVLVGHAMGADVALEAAGRLGDRVLGIIAVDSLKSVGLPPVPRGEIELRLKPFRSDFVGATRRMVSESLFRSDADPTFVSKVAYDMSLEPPEVALPSLEALLATDFATVLRNVHVPVLAINSDLTPTDVGRIARVIPGFSAEVIPHTGHFLMLEDPARFNPVLLRDLATLASRAH